jgi:hypothetical protein
MKVKGPEAVNEVRQISGRELLDSIRAIVEPLGGIDLPVYPRGAGKQRLAADFGPAKRRK